jgi:hypothetical protein
VKCLKYDSSLDELVYNNKGKVPKIKCTGVLLNTQGRK